MSDGDLYDFAATLARLEGRDYSTTGYHRRDASTILSLLGYEAAHHGRLGTACRQIGTSHWQSIPNFHSADDFELWVIGKVGGEIEDVGRDAEGNWHASYQFEGGNDYGYGRRMGTAMWAAFVALMGKVERD